MGLSGLVAAGAQQGLEQVLERRLQEAIRQQQEQQHAEQVALQRRQIDLSELRRVDDLKFREGQQTRADTEDILRDAAPGPISDQTAGVLSKTPLGQSRLTQRKLIEGVRPIAGSFGTMDESGPQSYSVLGPTDAQAKGKYKQIRLNELTKILSGATNEQQRRSVGAQALGEGIEIPNNLLGQTGTEKTAQELADEGRTNKEWDRRNNITNAQANTRQVRTELTPAQAFSATRQLRNDFVRETASAKTVAQQTAIMRESMQAAEQGNLAAGSQGVLVTFQKILDPGSVVRESEYARSASGQSLLNQMQGAVQTLQKGGAGIPLPELKRFVALADKFTDNQMKSAKATRHQIDAIAGEYGLNPDHITRDYDDSPDEPTTPVDSPYQQYVKRRKGGR